MAHQIMTHVDSVDLEAEEYVNSVMSSQPPAATLRTPLPSGRKRSLSASAATTEFKKHKGDNQSDKPQQTRAKKALLLCKDDKPTERDGSAAATASIPNKQRKQVKAARSGRLETDNDDSGRDQSDIRQRTDHQSSGCSSCDSDSDIKRLLRKLSDDMMPMHDALNKKIDLIEERIEQSEKKITDRVIDKMTKIVDKRVSSEATRIRKELNDKIENLKEDFNKELIVINSRLDNERRESSTANTDETDRRLRVVLLNLPETINENITEKVNSVIRDGLKVRGISVMSAERKESRNDATPGIVIAKFRSSEDKKSVMSAKKALRKTSQYKNVYINHDLSREERNMASNMRTLLNGVRQGQTMQVRGTRIVVSGETAEGRRGRRQDSREDHRRSSDDHDYRPHISERSNNQRQNESRNDNTRGNGQRETTRSYSYNDNRRGNGNRRRQ